MLIVADIVSLRFQSEKVGRVDRMFNHFKNLYVSYTGHFCKI